MLSKYNHEMRKRSLAFQMNSLLKALIIAFEIEITKICSHFVKSDTCLKLYVLLIYLKIMLKQGMEQ